MYTLRVRIKSTVSIACKELHTKKEIIAAWKIQKNQNNIDSLVFIGTNSDRFLPRVSMNYALSLMKKKIK